jgi:hypothetical protein
LEILLWKFLSDFIKSIEKNPIESFIYLSLIFLFVWLFKHYKELFSSNELDQKERVLKKLEFFGLLEGYLTLYIKNPSESSREKVTELIGKSYSYINQEERTRLEKSSMKIRQVPGCHQESCHSLCFAPRLKIGLLVASNPIKPTISSPCFI